MAEDKSNAIDDWGKFLNPQSLKSHLISASIYLAAWETFEHGIVRHLEGFYCFDFDANVYKHIDKYRQNVLSLDKSVFRATMLWFKKNEVINEDDLALADRARHHRNDIAHQLPAYIASASRNVDVLLLRDLCALLNKIDVWWIRNIEIPTNSEFDDQDVDAIPDSEIMSGNMVFLTLLLNIATGDESDSNQFYEGFIRTVQSKTSDQLKHKKKCK